MVYRAIGWQYCQPMPAGPHRAARPAFAVRATPDNQPTSWNADVKPSRVFLTALLPVVTYCGVGSGPSGMNGRLSFSYSGATSGTFDASGSIFSADPFGSTWAAGARDEANETLAVAANLART